MDWVQLATAVISLVAAVLSVVAVRRAGDVVKSQEVGRKATAGRDQTMTARQ